MAEIKYVVCAWCETAYRNGERRTIGYRMSDGAWTYEPVIFHTEENTSHSICPIHEKSPLEKFRKLSGTPKPEAGSE